MHNSRHFWLSWVNFHFQSVLLRIATTGDLEQLTSTIETCARFVWQQTNVKTRPKMPVHFPLTRKKLAKDIECQNTAACHPSSLVDLSLFDEIAMKKGTVYNMKYGIIEIFCWYYPTTILMARGVDGRRKLQIYHRFGWSFLNWSEYWSNFKAILK